jgi:hypothetical protein
MKDTRFVDGYLGYLLDRPTTRCTRTLTPGCAPPALSSIEWRVLATLHDGEALTVSQLAQDVLSKLPTVTRSGLANLDGWDKWEMWA